MVYSKKYKQPKKDFNRKKQFKKKEWVRYPQSIVPVGFPQTQMVKLRYVQEIKLDPLLSATIAQHSFRATSLFDPDASGVGHQPMGFDEWSLLYRKYLVVGARCKAEFSLTGNSTAAGGDGILVGGINLNTINSMSATDPYTVLEQGLTKSAAMSNKINTNMPQPVYCNYSAKKFFNLTTVNDNWSKIGALVTTNPSNNAHFIVWTGNTDPTVNPSPVSVLVTIEYIALFGEPKELTSS